MVVNNTTTVNNSGTIVTVNVLTGATSAIINRGTIGTVNNSGTVGSIYNSYSSSIGTINNSGKVRTIINSGTISTIYNYNIIGSINMGKSTNTIINNTGTINRIVTGEASIVGVNDTGTINGIILGLGSVKLTNVKNDVNIPLGNGWSYRYEVGDPNNPGNSTHMHLFQTNGKQSYSQNEDGGPKDEPKGGSGPPNSVIKKLKEKTGWNWATNDKNWLNKIEVSHDPAGYTLIEYPNGRTVIVYQPVNAFFMSYSPSDQNLRQYYFGPTYIDRSGGKTNTNPSGPIIVPIPDPVPIPVPAPAPVPIPVLP